MDPEVTAYLEELKGRMYTRTLPDRFGSTYLIPTGSLPREDWDRLFALVRDEKLITFMGSGLFGLSGYSLTAYEHPVQPGLDPEFVFHVYSEHVPEDQWPLDKHGRRENSKEFFDWVWEFFSGFTHSEQNREWIGMYPRWSQKHSCYFPRDRVHYDY